MPTTSASTLLTPPLLGLARIRVPGFASLNTNDRLQAAELALNRDLGITSPNLRLAALASETPDQALVAYCDGQTTSATSFATSLLGAMQPGRVYWVDAPQGYVVTARSAFAVELPAMHHDSLPSSIVMALSGATTLTLVNRDRSEITDDVLAHWRAASGIEIIDGPLPATSAIPLQTVPRRRVSEPVTALDRTLGFSAIAAIVCAVLGTAQFFIRGEPALLTGATSTIKGGTTLRAQNVGAGTLLDRIATTAPDLLPQLQFANYAGGAWVLQLPASVDASGLQRMVRSLEVNGLSVQHTQSPSPRLRVALPQ